MIMSDLISRQKAIDAVKWWFGVLKQNPDILIDAITTLPDAEVQGTTAKVDKLPEKNQMIMHTLIAGTCKNCNFLLSISHNYCPHCGAKLIWEDDNA